MEESRHGPNLPLLNSLRKSSEEAPYLRTRKSSFGGGPPSFYDDDVQRWENKFKKEVDMR